MREHTRASEALAASLTLVLSFVTVALPFGCECTPHEVGDAGSDVGADAPSIDARSVDARRRDAWARDARVNDGGRDTNDPDTALNGSNWTTLPELFEACAVRQAVDPQVALGPWGTEACPGLSACERLVRSGFENPELGSFYIVQGLPGPPARVLVGFETHETARPEYARATLAILRRDGVVENVVHAETPPLSVNPCRILASGGGTDWAFSVWDHRDGRPDLSGARYLLYRLPFGVSSAFEYVTTMTHEGLSGSSPQNISTSADFIGIRLGLGNRIVAVQNDGTYGFAEPAPPYDFVRQQGEPHVVGEYMLTNAPLTPTSNGLFMSHLGAPSERIWPADAVGEVVADENWIVWIQGRAVYETIQLQDAMLWRAPFHAGAIVESEAAPIADFYDVARRYGDGRGGTFLGMRMGGGYVATPNGLSNRCWVVRIADGRMASVDVGADYVCNAVMYVNETEVGVAVNRAGDMTRTYELWMIPHDALTFR